MQMNMLFQWNGPLLQRFQGGNYKFVIRKSFTVNNWFNRTRLDVCEPRVVAVGMMGSCIYHSLQNIYREGHEQNLSITDSDDVNTMKVSLELCEI